MEISNKRKISQSEITHSPENTDKKRDCRPSPAKLTLATKMADLVMDVDTSPETIAYLLEGLQNDNTIEIAKRIVEYLDKTYKSTLKRLVVEKDAANERIEMLENKVTSLEAYSRRNNLVLTGVPEWCGTNYSELNNWFDEFCEMLNIETTNLKRRRRRT